MAAELIFLLALIALVGMFKVHDWREATKMRSALIGQNELLLKQNRELTRLIALSKGIPALDKYLMQEQMTEDQATQAPAAPQPMEPIFES